MTTDAIELREQAFSFRNGKRVFFIIVRDGWSGKDRARLKVAHANGLDRKGCGRRNAERALLPLAGTKKEQSRHGRKPGKIANDPAAGLPDTKSKPGANRQK